MKKIFYISLLLILPNLLLAGNKASWGNIVWPGSRSNIAYLNEDEIVTGHWELYDVTIDTLTGDSIYTRILLLPTTSGRLYFGTDGDTYLKEGADDSLLFVIKGNTLFRLDDGGIYIDTLLTLGLGEQFAFGDGSTLITLGADDSLLFKSADVTKLRIDNDKIYVDTTIVIDDQMLPDANVGADLGTAGTIMDSIFVDNLKVTTDISNDGETFLGDALTDTTEVFRVRFKGKVIFDSLATGVNYIDFTNADNASASTYWINANSNNYWITNGYLRAGNMQAVFGQWMSDDVWYGIGNGSSYSVATSASLLWETADANANVLLLTMPEGGATDVPVFVIGDSTSYNKDLGWFNGKTNPSIALVSDLANGAMRIVGQSETDSLSHFESYGVNKGFEFDDDVRIDSTLTIGGRINGNSAICGSDAFSGTAVADTITIGASLGAGLTNDSIGAFLTGAVGDSSKYLYTIILSDTTFSVNRQADGDANQTYTYHRISLP